MGTAGTIDEQILGFLKLLNMQQKYAILNVMKTFTSSDEETVWDEASFVAEMDTRYTALANGSIKGHSWDEVKEMARKSVKELKGK